MGQRWLGTGGRSLAGPAGPCWTHPPPDNCSGLTRIPPGCALALGLQICQRRAPGRPCTPISECILAGGLQGVEGTSSLAGAPSLQVWLQTLSAAPESFLTPENKHHLGKRPSRPGFVLTNSTVIRLPPRTPYPSTAASCSTDPTGCRPSSVHVLPLDLGVLPACPSQMPPPTSRPLR